MSAIVPLLLALLLLVGYAIEGPVLALVLAGALVVGLGINRLARSK